jgi:AHBA synthesis associated protein
MKGYGMLKAIVFDLDGVLIDSEPLMRVAFAESYRQIIGDGPAPIEAYLEHMGKPFPQIMDCLGLPHSLWAPFKEICRRRIEMIKLFPESRGLLDWAQRHDLGLALLTGKDEQRTAEILEHFAIGSYFTAVLTPEQLTRPKPDPEGILCALEALGCEPEHAVMVGDSTSDVLCAQQAGVPAIAVTWGIRPDLVQRNCRPDYLVHTWRGLQQTLAQLRLAPVKA